MDADTSSSNPSLDHSNLMIVTEESPDSSKKRKLRGAEESDFLPLPKHFCHEQQRASLSDSSCPSSDIEFTECSYATKDTRPGCDETASSASITEASSSYTSKDNPCYSTGCSSSNYATSTIDQCYSKGNDYKTQEYVEDLSDIAVEDLLNPVVSYTLSSSRWSISSQDSEDEEATTTPKPTIDQEFEEYFSTLMM